MTAVREFALPDLGEGLTEATVVRWLVSVGEVVAVDQPVVEVETAKALVDVPCPYGGVVTARYGEEGAEIPVGAPLVTVAVGASADGPADTETAGAAGAAETAGAAEGTRADDGAGESAVGGANSGDSGESSGNVLVGYGTADTAVRRRRARAAAPSAAPRPAAGEPAPGASHTGAYDAAGARVDTAAAAAGTGDGRGGQGAYGKSAYGKNPAAAAGGSAPLPVISPLVRRLAREHGIDLRTLRGSGPYGLILRADVDRAVRERAAGTEPGAASAEEAAAAPSARARGRADGSAAVAERVPLTGLRATVADKLSRSRREIPDATCWVDADATELLAARRAMNAHADARGAARVSLLALLARICTAALSRFPELNASVDEEAREIVRFSGVHLGFAAQTERGLVVPVVRDAHALDMAGLDAEMARLTESARAGTLTPRELTGGTFTLNNYGVFGVDGSTPIINHPEAGMLGVGRITGKPWAVQGELAVRSVVQLSFTFDHRVCDGGTAGGFLRYVADCVEQPAVLLRTL